MMSEKGRMKTEDRNKERFEFAASCLELSLSLGC